MAAVYYTAGVITSNTLMDADILEREVLHCRRKYSTKAICFLDRLCFSTLSIHEGHKHKESIENCRLQNSLEMQTFDFGRFVYHQILLDIGIGMKGISTDYIENH